MIVLSFVYFHLFLLLLSSYPRESSALLFSIQNGRGRSLFRNRLFFFKSGIASGYCERSPRYDNIPYLYNTSIARATGCRFDTYTAFSFLFLGIVRSTTFC